MSFHAESIEAPPSDEYIVIQDIHSRLNKFLSDLKDACCNQPDQLNCDSCTCEKNASCRGQLPSYFHDLIHIVGTHFYYEESIMLNRPNVTGDNEHFRLHCQAHMRLMGEVGFLVKECTALSAQGTTAEAYRHFYKRLLELIQKHDQDFDDPFFQLTISS